MDEIRKKKDYVEIDFLTLLEALSRRKLLILFMTLSAILISGVLSYFILLPVYEAQTTYLVIQGDVREQGNTSELDPIGIIVASLSRLPELNVNTYIEQIKDPQLMNNVINKLTLPQKKYSVGSLAESIHVAPVKDTNLIEVSVQNINGELALRIIETLTELMLESVSRSAQLQVDKYLASLQAQLDSIKNELAVLRPIVEKLDQQSTCSASFRQELAKVKAELAKQQVVLTAAIETPRQFPLELQVLELEARVKELTTEIEVRDVQCNENTKKIANLETTYDLLIRQMTQIQLARSVNMGDMSLQVLSGPTLLDRPVKPKKIFNMTVAGLVAFIASLFLAIVLENSKRKLHSLADIENLLGIPALGMVPVFPHGKLVSYTDSRSAEAEYIKILRANLSHYVREHDLHTILFTGILPREGTSLLLANLAANLAQAGHQVVVVDANLRSPALHRLLYSGGLLGLTDILSAEGATLSDVLSTTMVDGVTLISSGSTVHNSTELLGSEGMRNLLQELAANFQFVLIDSPPILAVADTHVLSRWVDGVVVVMTEGKVTVRQVQEAAKRLGMVRDNIIGVILNRVKRINKDFYCYDYKESRGRRK